MSTDLTFEDLDRIEEIFEGKTVLITGATGFLGKVLTEKLLMACPKVKYVVTLVRTKKGKNAEQRMQDVLKGPLYDTLRSMYGPDHLKKVKAIQGDISEDGLNLSQEDRSWICQQVQVVFHLAATIRFDLPLKTAVLMNVKGTKEMLELAKQMKNLQVFHYVSTAYCHLEEKELFERTYDPPADPHRVLKLCDCLGEEDIELIAPRLIGSCPNTYAFTKALSEALVAEEMENIPVLILRPSVVVPIWKEPIPGWTDNLNGVAGLLLGAGKGVIRTMYIKENACADFIPVDMVANVLLLVTFFHTMNPSKRIYHNTASKEFQISYEEIINLSRKIVETKIPLPGVAWYPGGSVKRSRIHNNISFFLYHWIPAIIADAILYLLGYDPVLMRVQRRVAKGCRIMEYYANHKWSFNNQETIDHRKHLNQTEIKKYKYDFEGADFEEYMTNCIISVRRFILNEPDETLPACKGT